MPGPMFWMTADLGMRFGLHSGPVTAGVLRGSKARFQLFGDTVNIAAKMESMGETNKIQLSHQTADLLVAYGKFNWVKPRQDRIHVKGKGELQTFWLVTENDALLGMSMTSHHSMASNSASRPSVRFHEFSASEEFTLANPTKQREKRHERLIAWNTEVLLELLKKVVAMRGEEETGQFDNNMDTPQLEEFKTYPRGQGEGGSDATVLDEVKEIITLPGKASKYKTNPLSVEIPTQVVQQLHHYVSSIASLYRKNPFHSFDHASHVTQSVIKLLSRVVTPDSFEYSGGIAYSARKKTASDSEELHEFTYGITSDPLTQFAVAFAALIHDVDHQGVPNAQLVQEKSEIAILYKNKSVAEQNSVDLAWELLMEPTYKELRGCIYKNQCELDRFRQLVVNAVMATDIVDKELGALRKKRWEKAFYRGSGIKTGAETSELSPAESTEDEVNRKATIVIEHLIQASDVSHTMQHWYVYIKWNERLFHEMYGAYKTGRADKDPSEFWFRGELGFYDYYIIPLALKLKECGVFGVSSDEYLNYALANRTEWEKKGAELVEQYVKNYHDQEKLGLEWSEATQIPRPADLSRQKTV